METKDSKNQSKGSDSSGAETPIYKRPHFILIAFGVVILGAFFLVGGQQPTSKKHDAESGSSEGSATQGHGERDSANTDIETRTVLHRLSWSALVETYGQAWLKIQKRIDELRHSEEENIKLRNENAQLKLGVELAQFNCHALTASRMTNESGSHLEQETGSRVGRTLAALTYRPPGKLTPAQLFTLGVSYFKAQEMEKAAVIFTNLTGLEENTTYKNAQAFLLAGVAWFYLENYSLSNSYFDQVLKEPKRPDNTTYLAQARLWKALISSRLGKPTKSQYWLKDLLDNHPHSNEAAWINGELHAKTDEHPKEEYAEGELSDSAGHGATEKGEKKEAHGAHGHERSPAASQAAHEKGRSAHD